MKRKGSYQVLRLEVAMGRLQTSGGFEAGEYDIEKEFMQPVGDRTSAIHRAIPDTLCLVPDLYLNPVEERLRCYRYPDGYLQDDNA
jgi:hypothetical protein